MDELQIPEGATFRIQLATFEGPLDLLLHLIKKHELNILDLPIAFVTERYLDYLQMMQELDLDVASEYLLMAATLAHIKSKMLLPQNPLDEVEEQEDGYVADPRAELIRRLLEYQKYRAAAEQLGSRPIVGRDVFGRGVQAEEAQGPAPLAPIDLYKLLDAFGAILKRVQGRVALEVTAERITIHERISEISEMLRSKRSCVFEELFAKDRTRYEVVVTFLALLEMTKLRMTRIYQADPGAPLHVQYALLDADADAEAAAAGALASEQGGVAESEAPEAFAEGESEAPEAFAGSDSEAPEAFAGSDSEAPEEFAGSESEAPEAFAGSEREAPEAFAADEADEASEPAFESEERSGTTNLDAAFADERDESAQPDADATLEPEVDGLTAHETNAFAELHAQAVQEFADEHEAPTAEHDALPIAHAAFAETESAPETFGDNDSTPETLASPAAQPEVPAEADADAFAQTAAGADAFAETFAGTDPDAEASAAHEAPTAEFDALPLASADASEPERTAATQPSATDDATTAPDPEDPDSGEEPPAGERETPA